jgi:hypothetical protein
MAPALLARSNEHAGTHCVPSWTQNSVLSLLQPVIHTAQIHGPSIVPRCPLPLSPPGKLVLGIHSIPECADPLYIRPKSEGTHPRPILPPPAGRLSLQFSDFARLSPGLRSVGLPRLEPIKTEQNTPSGATSAGRPRASPHMDWGELGGVTTPMRWWCGERAPARRGAP